VGAYITKKPEGLTLFKASKLIMAGTFSQVYVQIIFAVKGRHGLIQSKWKTDLHKYIAGIIKGKEQKPIIVNGMPDHIHAFVGLRPSMSISDLARDIKNNSSKFINQQGWVKGKFLWQEGYGAFSYGHSQISAVYNYILNQEEHHRKKTFKQEYIQFLKKFDVPYDEKYLFEWIDY
jgi:putative transposase